MIRVKYLKIAAFLFFGLIIMDGFGQEKNVSTISVDSIIKLKSMVNTRIDNIA